MLALLPTTLWTNKFLYFSLFLFVLSTACGRRKPEDGQTTVSPNLSVNRRLVSSLSLSLSPVTACWSNTQVVVDTVSQSQTVVPHKLADKSL